LNIFSSYIFGGKKPSRLLCRCFFVPTDDGEEEKTKIHRGSLFAVDKVPDIFKKQSTLLV